MPKNNYIALTDLRSGKVLAMTADPDGRFSMWSGMQVLDVVVFPPTPMRTHTDAHVLFEQMRHLFSLIRGNGL